MKEGIQHRLGQNIVDATPRVFTLWRIFFYQREIMNAEHPLFIGNVAGAGYPIAALLEIDW